MQSSNAANVIAALDSVENFLSQPNGVARFEEGGGLDVLEQLQSHESEAIYKRAVGLLEKFFAAEEDDENIIAPEVAATVFAAGAGDALNSASSSSDSDDDDDGVRSMCFSTKLFG